MKKRGRYEVIATNSVYYGYTDDSVLLKRLIM